MTLSDAKKAFYPEPAVARVLTKAPPKKLSEWVNRLILKGMEMEKREKLARDYANYDRELAAGVPAGKKRAKFKVANPTRIARPAELEKLFTPEDETTDWY